MTTHAHALRPPPEGALHTYVDDHAVIAASLERPDAFGELFDRHAVELHRFLSRRLGERADDLLGELFATAFERRAGYRQSSTTCRENCDERPRAPRPLRSAADRSWAGRTG